MAFNGRSHRRKKRKDLMKKIVGGMVIALTTLIVVAASFLTYVAVTNDSAIYQEVSETTMRDEQVNTDELDPISVLLIGTDQRADEEDGTGRADALMVVTVNPKTGEAYVVSIPRDSYVDIPEYGNDKIAHAYSYGGEELTIKTVEQFLDIPIDYYVRLNFEGFEQLVDAMGGVTVYNDFAFEQFDCYYPEGELHLNGHEALNYCRMRKSDPEGDFGRQERQAEVIASLIESAKEMDSVNDVVAVFEAVDEGNMATNVTPQEVWDIMWDYAPEITQVTYLQLNYYSYQPGDTWYAKIDDVQRLEVTYALRSNLELELRPWSYYVEQGWDIPDEKPHGKAISGDETAEDIHRMQEEQDQWEEDFLNSLYAGSESNESDEVETESYSEDTNSSDDDSYQAPENESDSSGDSDGDGIANGQDTYPNNPDADGDGLIDGNDPNPGSSDTDGDGLSDGEDPDPTTPEAPEEPEVPETPEEPLDSDGDGLLDSVDPYPGSPDGDGDGLLDGEDPDPINPSLSP